MTDDSPLLVDQRDGVLTLTLNRPDRLNALTHQLSAALTTQFKTAARDSEIRAILLTGAGRGFCAGQDLLAVLEQSDGQPISFRQHLNTSYHPLVSLMRSLEKPIVAAINGAVAGAGLGLALATDLRLASTTAKFRAAFSGIGLVPDSGVSYFLAQLLGPARAAEVLMLNEPISAEQAEQWGLINRVLPPDDLLPTAQAIAAQLAAGPTLAYGLTKRALNRALTSDLQTVLDYEAQLQEIAGHSTDFTEGVSAFLQKRTPNFTGR